MTAINCYAATSHDVPVDDEWLAPAEVTVLGALTVPKRCADWRLGRWVAKQAIAHRLHRPTSRHDDLAAISIVAADDGAPEPRLDGVRAPLTLSISHRAGRGVAAVAASEVMLGCDLELIEPRSDAFMREWFAPEEQHDVARATPDERPRLTNAIWVAKESAAKALREGLRLNVRRAVVDIHDDEVGGGWHTFAVECRGEGITFGGCWREHDGFVVGIAASPAPGVPTYRDARSPGTSR